MRIAIIGGTGKEGRGLALGWARAGQEILIGSRDTARAAAAAAAINDTVGRPAASGVRNRDAAAAADVVVLSVPYAAHRETLAEIREAARGKVLVDVTVPIDPERPRRLRDMPGSSAAEEAQAFLGLDARVVAAFQNVSHTHLEASAPPDCDVLVCGDDPKARAATIHLAKLLGLRGIDAGSLRNARVVEGLTVLLLAVNRRYGVKGAGIRVTGLPIAAHHAGPAGHDA
jgi:NADPH-dependent F420 reductase